MVGSPTEPDSLVEIDPASRQGDAVFARAHRWRPTRSTRRFPEAIEFPTDGGKTAHAFYYPPTNRDFRGPTGEAPPLLVMIHGGPTSATAASVSAADSVLDVARVRACAT